MARDATRALSNLEGKIILVGKMDLSVSKISESCPLKPGVMPFHGGMTVAQNTRDTKVFLFLKLFSHTWSWV